MQTNQPTQNQIPVEPNSQPTNSSTTAQPQSLQPTPKKKKPWLLITIIVLLLSATGVLGYKYYELQQKIDKLQQPTPSSPPQLVVSSPSPTTSQTSKENPTAGWKSYQNGNYSYNLKYPDSWKTTPSIIKGSKTESVGLHGAEFQGKIVYLSTSYPQNPTMPFVQIETSTNETQESYNTRKQSRPDSQETLIDNFQAVTGKRQSSPEPGTIFDKEGYTYSWFVFNNNLNNIYEITCSEDLSNFGLCEQIISTFRFTN